MAVRTQIKKIVSGGQTGVDRAALDVAIRLGIPHGGFCPKGRRSESGRIPDKYRLMETETEVYGMRTELNVEHSDATLVLTNGPPDGGTQRTIELCSEHHKPLLVLDLTAAPRAEEFDRWLSANHVQTLNVAGPRESNQPGIYVAAYSALLIVLAEDI